MGAVPFLLDEVHCPIYGSRLTLGLLRAKLVEFHDVEDLDAREVAAGEPLQLGPFTFDFVRVNHSIPEPAGLGIHTPAGLIVHSGDFKFDPTPPYGLPADLHKFGEFGQAGTTLLICDCTNVERPGYTPSERLVSEAFEQLFRTRPGRLIIATFASNLGRVQQVLDVAAQAGRRVAITGRSMSRMMDVGIEVGVVRVPEETLIPIEEIDQHPDRELAIVTTGTQGEPLSALSLMAQGQHKYVQVRPGDTVVFSASVIPGNEGTILHTINQLFRRGADVVHGREAGVHVSGHGSQEELKLLLALVQPRYVVPIHGEYRHLIRYRELAETMGVPPEHAFVLEPGEVIELSEGVARRGEPVAGGSVNVDGLGVGDVKKVVLRDRQQLTESGIILPVLVVDGLTCEPVAPPDVYSRGFVYVEQAADLMETLKAEISAVVETLREEGALEAEPLRQRLRSRLRRLVQQLTGRRPIVLPIVIELGGPHDLSDGEEAGQEDLPFDAANGKAVGPDNWALGGEGEQQM